MSIAPGEYTISTYRETPVKKRKTYVVAFTWHLSLSELLLFI